MTIQKLQFPPIYHVNTGKKAHANDSINKLSQPIWQNTPAVKKKAKELEKYEAMPYKKPELTPVQQKEMEKYEKI